jgi:hypothetical protein
MNVHFGVVIPAALDDDLCPFSAGYRNHDCGVVGEEAPSGAASLDDVRIGVPHGVGELVLAQVFPDVLGCVELWRIGRQGDQGEIAGNLDAPCAMIARAVDDHDAVGVRGNSFGDLAQMQVEAFGVRVRQDERGAGPALRAGRAEDMGPVITPVARGARARALLGPDARQRSLLPNPCFVLEPDLDRL